MAFSRVLVALMLALVIYSAVAANAPGASPSISPKASPSASPIATQDSVCTHSCTIHHRETTGFRSKQVSLGFSTLTSHRRPRGSRSFPCLFHFHRYSSFRWCSSLHPWELCCIEQSSRGWIRRCSALRRRRCLALSSGSSSSYGGGGGSDDE